MSSYSACRFCSWSVLATDHNVPFIIADKLPLNNPDWECLILLDILQNCSCSVTWPTWALRNTVRGVATINANAWVKGSPLLLILTKKVVLCRAQHGERHYGTWEKRQVRGMCEVAKVALPSDCLNFLATPYGCIENGAPPPHLCWLSSCSHLHF